MPARLPFAASLLALVISGLAGEPPARLLVQADYAIVDVDESSAARRSVKLPALGFPLRIEPLCPPGARTDSVTISVADTRDTFHSGAFEDQGVLETIFHVPEQQIGLLSVEHFCMAGDIDGSRHVLRVRDVPTAQASLRCVNEARQTVVYDAIGLHVELRCRRPEPAGGQP